MFSKIMNISLNGSATTILPGHAHCDCLLRRAAKLHVTRVSECFKQKKKTYYALHRVNHDLKEDNLLYEQSNVSGQVLQVQDITVVESGPKFISKTSSVLKIALIAFILLKTLF